MSVNVVPVGTLPTGVVVLPSRNTSYRATPTLSVLAAQFTRIDEDDSTVPVPPVGMEGAVVSGAAAVVAEAAVLLRDSLLAASMADTVYECCEAAARPVSEYVVPVGTVAMAVAAPSR